MAPVVREQDQVLEDLVVNLVVHKEVLAVHNLVALALEVHNLEALAPEAHNVEVVLARAVLHGVLVQQQPVKSLRNALFRVRTGFAKQNLRSIQVYSKPLKFRTAPLQSLGVLVRSRMERAIGRL
jgi:hypothetical protein